MADNLRCCVINLGTGHISAVIAEIHAPDNIEVLGMEYTQNRGMSQGKIVSMDKVVAGIKHVVQSAEHMADCRVHSAWLCVTSPELRSFNGCGRVACLSGEVVATDIVASLSKAKQQQLVDDYYVVNHMQHGISLDDGEALIAEPLGMLAQHIEGFYHLMMLPVGVMQNIQKALHASGVHLGRMLVANIATSSYALLPDEREYGVCLIDIGAGTTSISVYFEDRLLLSHCMDVGGDMVTRDIATELGISADEAERIKVLHANISTSDIDASKMLNIPAKNDHPDVSISLRELGEIAAARYEEILDDALAIIESRNLMPALTRGIVYAGGGVQITGFTRFARQKTQLSAQLANFPPQIKVARADKKRLERYFYQGALGTILYGQSGQFARNLQSEPPDDPTWTERIFVKPYQALVAFFSRVF